MRWLLIILLLLPATAFAQSFTLSEEDPPAACPTGTAVAGFQCSGDFCDNITITCRAIAGRAGVTDWTEWVEADGQDTAWCSNPGLGITSGDGPIGDFVMTGLACRGDNCDDISLQCTRFPVQIDRATCITTRHSDENRGVGLPPGHVIAGIRCSGRHCDNKDITYCGTNPL
ncbi:hypothetical protein [Nioella ostreopsis]|uniref:hypothetical protein n=1 Tax=Nioella ostreopsis TaxID=2448479 RepID=UPI000FD79E5E|nr:hypothetical protein [Nioella ostreopsis]